MSDKADLKPCCDNPQSEHRYGNGPLKCVNCGSVCRKGPQPCNVKRCDWERNGECRSANYYICPHAQAERLIDQCGDALEQAKLGLLNYIDSQTHDIGFIYKALSAIEKHRKGE